MQFSGLVKRAVSLAGLVGLVALAPVATASDQAPAGIKFESRGFGWVLQDDKGMTLYTTVKDQTPGKSACEGDCAEQWPPVLAPEDARAEGDWSLVKRSDGKLQWAFRDQPLYRSSRDLSPGDSYGDGMDREWSLATKYVDRPVGVDVARTILGYVLVDARSGTALYKYTKDGKNKSACTGDCVRNWAPLKASAVAVARGDWTIVERGDGIRQWAYKGTPLYRYAGDLAPGDTRGHEADGKRWLAYVLEPLPPLPAWVTVQASDAGLILADSRGRTLYGRTLARVRNQNLGEANNRANASSRPYELNPASSRPYDLKGGTPEVAGAGSLQSANKAMPMTRTTFCVECPRSYWEPVFANEHDKPTGNWSIVKRQDGKLQWAFKGEPLYTHGRDTWPGALNGVRSGDRSWHALMLSGLPMQGTGT
jgi:predicted lipoprotein with Yx(FWY)xxD motif